MTPAPGRTPEFEFGSWTASQLQTTIEYPLEVMDEIRAYACDELRQLSHGDREVGGVIFGVRREDSVRILTWRPIHCEYADGDRLHLSAVDRMALAVQLERARLDLNLKDLRPAGWFVSHLHNAVALLPADRETYDGFFPESWQFTLVLHPTGAGVAKAGFFQREPHGSLKADASYREFLLEPLHAAEIVDGLPPIAHSAVMAPAAPPEPAPALHAPTFDLGEQVTSKERWLWSIPIVLALGLAGLALYHWQSAPENRPAATPAPSQASVQPQEPSAKPSVAPPDNSAELAQLRAERDQLAAKVREQDEELRKERARADQLQNLVRILENRLGIKAGASATK